MSTNVYIKPLRDYDPHDVINLYAYTGDSLTKGNFVAITRGYDTDVEPNNVHGQAGASYTNVYSPRWSITPRVGIAYSGNSISPLGMTLRTVVETDENGNKLLYDRQKQDELQAILSGQAVPILTKGLVLYSGIQGATAITAGIPLYVAGPGVIGAGGLDTVGLAADKVGKTLGAPGTDGYTLIKIEL